MVEDLFSHITCHIINGTPMTLIAYRLSQQPQAHEVHPPPRGMLTVQLQIFNFLFKNLLAS